MPKKSTVLLIAFIFGVGALLVSCAGMQTKPTATNFKDPVITNDRLASMPSSRRVSRVSCEYLRTRMPANGRGSARALGRCSSSRVFGRW